MAFGDLAMKGARAPDTGIRHTHATLALKNHVLSDLDLIAATSVHNPIVYAGPVTVRFQTISLPTTAAPTAAPTTLAPTTLAPTTLAPTTAVPTGAPTTGAPTTAAPTTPSHTTDAPATTPAPTTAATFEITVAPEVIDLREAEGAAVRLTITGAGFEVGAALSAHSVTLSAHRLPSSGINVLSTVTMEVCVCVCVCVSWWTSWVDALRYSAKGWCPRLFADLYSVLSASLPPSPPPRSQVDIPAGTLSPSDDLGYHSVVVVRPDGATATLDGVLFVTNDCPEAGTGLCQLGMWCAVILSRWWLFFLLPDIPSATNGQTMRSRGGGSWEWR